MNKKKRGRPLGGEYPPEVRKVWREVQRKYRAKKKLQESLSTETGENGK